MKKTITRTAGVGIESGEAVYIADNGRVYPLNHRRWWRRLLEWLHIVKRPVPIGIMLTSAKPGEPQQVCTSDIQFSIGASDVHGDICYLKPGQ